MMTKSTSGAGMGSRLFASLLLALILATPAAGQTVRIVGRVIDDVTGRGLGSSLVGLQDERGRVLSRVETDASGAFGFEIDTDVRAVQLNVQRLSYENNLTPVLHFDGRRFFQVEVRLDPDAMLLAPLEVVAWSRVDRSPLLDGFRHRLETGQGIYITRADVEQKRPMYVTDLLRDVSGLTVQGSGSGLRPVVTVARNEAKGCSAQIFVDGFLINRRVGGGQPFDLRIDDAVSPMSVEGIEIYRGLSTVPAEFLNPDAGCGVIAIWTKRGGRV